MASNQSQNLWMSLANWSEAWRAPKNSTTRQTTINFNPPTSNPSIIKLNRQHKKLNNQTRVKNKHFPIISLCFRLNFPQFSIPLCCEMKEFAIENFIVTFYEWKTSGFSIKYCNCRTYLVENFFFLILQGIFRKAKQ